MRIPVARLATWFGWVVYPVEGAPQKRDVSNESSDSTEQEKRRVASLLGDADLCGPRSNLTEIHISEPVSRWRNGNVQRRYLNIISEYMYVTCEIKNGEYQ